MPENLKEFLFMRLPGSEDNCSPLRFTRKLELFLVICHRRSEEVHARREGDHHDHRDGQERGLPEPGAGHVEARGLP